MGRLSRRDEYLINWEKDREVEKVEEARLNINKPMESVDTIKRKADFMEVKQNETKSELERKKRKEEAEKEEKEREELERKWEEQDHEVEKTAKSEDEVASLKAEEEKEAARLKEIEARKKEIEEELARERRHLEELKKMELSLRSSSPITSKPPKAALQYEEMVARKSSKSPTPRGVSPSFEVQERQRIAELHRIKELKMMEEQKMRELSILQNAKKNELLNTPNSSSAIIPAPPAFNSSPSASPDPLNRNGQLVTSLPPLPPQKQKQQVVP